MHYIIIKICFINKNAVRVSYAGQLAMLSGVEMVMVFSRGVNLGVGGLTKGLFKNYVIFHISNDSHTPIPHHSSPVTMGLKNFESC